ncbi:MAG: hypothetical protein J0L93_10565 [Deltaproteobacteria bacterium]|nr:hypothetical protein [Deltaproteobacteria bacterium]
MRFGSKFFSVLFLVSCLLANPSQSTFLFAQENPHRAATAEELSQFEEFLESELENVDANLKQNPSVSRQPDFAQHNAHRLALLNLADNPLLVYPLTAVGLFGAISFTYYLNNLFGVTSQWGKTAVAVAALSISFSPIPGFMVLSYRLKKKYQSTFKYLGSPSFDPIYGAQVPPKEFLDLNELVARSEWSIDNIHRFLNLYPEWNKFFERMEDLAKKFDHAKLEPLETKDPRLHTWIQDVLRPWLRDKAQREIYMSWKENISEALEKIREQRERSPTTETPTLVTYPQTISNCIATLQRASSIGS